MLIQFDIQIEKAIHRIVYSLEVIAKCQLKQTQIAEQSFKEAKELRDITMGRMKKDLKFSQKVDIIVDKKLLKDLDDTGDQK